jgi:hypothetical protein
MGGRLRNRHSSNVHAVFLSRTTTANSLHGPPFSGVFVAIESRVPPIGHDNQWVWLLRTKQVCDTGLSPLTDGVTSEACGGLRISVGSKLPSRETYDAKFATSD